MSAERKTAEAILQKPFTVLIGGRTFEVAPPSNRTIIEVSGAVASLPKTYNKKGNVLNEALRIAKDCGSIGDILAILILGGKNLTERVKTPKKRFLWIITEWEEKTINRKRELADFILDNQKPSETAEMTALLFNRLEIGDFFGFTTSLIDLNMIRPTKEVES
jgi:hypothetical protein